MTKSNRKGKVGESATPTTAVAINSESKHIVCSTDISACDLKHNTPSKTTGNFKVKDVSKGPEAVRTLAMEVEQWDGQESGGGIIRRNVLIFVFFYLPMIGFIIGTTYLAVKLAKDRPPRKPPLVWKKPAKDDIFCLLVIPPLTYVTNMLTAKYSPRVHGVKFIQSIELFIVGQIWAAMSNRVGLMYVMFIKGNYTPNYKIFLLKAVLIVMVFQELPFIVAMTVSFPKYTWMIKWGAFTYAMITLFEIAVYVVRMGSVVRLFVDFENVVRMMVMQAILLSIGITLYYQFPDGRAFFRYNQTMVLVWQLIFEMFGSNLWNEFVFFFGLKSCIIGQNKLICKAYDLVDPRGRLDSILDDEELYPILLRIARARYMDENFMFLHDTRDLKGRAGSEQAKRLRNGDLEATSAANARVQTVLQNYVVVGAVYPVNLPSRLLKPLRELNEEAQNFPATNLLAGDTVCDLLSSARAYTASLIDQSLIMNVFSQHKDVLDVLESRRHRLMLSCGSDAKLAVPTSR
ncbi:hypothetical protein SARC_12374 [Sphaeroforma arctica JP610]|uniref:RGS domain-containing protein n=1 Tax=Sphaeroforma arctica JP610 TaxID=667725 RepID=A0A0L0FEB0_9EUKA|nr:hypothetical protein SARC_12374 [Sphaeroforma arctica JP610]KNC75094.1 hypothetical protein SARC_12374 [Sphaeroforma arctica JP610]|eukprot:XP_014148996.1 hypothetical protein SARC_12374 [Sphaeroforma arctica JP610]